MAGPFQAGDLINFGRLAWEVYQLGWSEDHNATKQYNEFGRDVRGLAESLDILTRVVSQANSSLQTQNGYNAVVRWDPVSLRSIVGDYEATLQECFKLIKSNNRYRVSSTPLKNIEFNVLVQPSADRLRQRIALHNSKILHVLKPFEIDLLYRVRQDIYRVHHDLATRITAVHNDLNHLMGVLIPDLQQALNQQSHRQIHLLEVPIDIAERFRFTALADRPAYGSDAAFQLEELSDAFVLNYHRSTVHFRSGLLVSDRVPPLEQYLNLLKCVWLFKRIKNSPSILNTAADSHWPSYVRQLEEDLSVECGRFGPELVQPELLAPALRRDLFTIWPETEPEQLVDVVTQDEMMEQVLEVPLESSGASIERGIKLLRRMGADGRRFRIMISGQEQTATGKPRRQTEVIDFDVTSAIINPQYALPSSNGIMQEMILRRDERIAKLSFQKMSHVLKFQQAVTGYKAWAAYSQYNAMASFVVAGRKEPVVERACIQLWIPKPLDGSLVTNADVAPDTNPSVAPTRSSTTMTSSSYGGVPISELDSHSLNGRVNTLSTSASTRAPSFPNSATQGAMPIPRADGSRNTNDGIFDMGELRSNLMTSTDNLSRSPDRVFSSPMNRQASLQSPTRKPVPQRNPGAFSSTWTAQSPPPPISCSPPGGGSMFLTGEQQRPSPMMRSTIPSSPPQLGYLSPTTTNGMGRSTTARTNSVSSAVSSAVSNTSNSSGSDSHTVVVSTGSSTTGFLHRRPPKPMLVLFTQDPKSGELSFVTVQIDEKTAVNPERCNCRQSGRAGAACPIAAIEREKGDVDLDARRYELSRPGGEMDWNLARLALNNPASSSDSSSWSNLKRVSIMFPRPEDRALFGGTPNQCNCRNKKNLTVGELAECLRLGHKGLWGEVQEHYRKKGNEYHDVRFKGQKHVVNGLMS